jgi:hypothetical protein
MTSGRLVQVRQDSSSRLFARQNTPETVSSPRFRTNWLAEVVDLVALARCLLSPFPRPAYHDASAFGFNECTIQPLIPDLPFGGVSNSGIGKYHGEWGFRT